MKTGVPAMRTGVPCNKNRFFLVWKTSHGKPCSGPVLALYRIAVWTKLLFHKFLVSNSWLATSGGEVKNPIMIFRSGRVYKGNGLSIEMSIHDMKSKAHLDLHMKVVY